MSEELFAGKAEGLAPSPVGPLDGGNEFDLLVPGHF